ncbi:MAG: flagellar basal body-associated protein FliL, partial [Bacteroidia bacterium]
MIESTNTEIREEEERKSKALPLFIFLFLASLAMCAFLFFKYAKNAAKIQQQNEELSLAYQTLDLKADSLQKEL